MPDTPITFVFLVTKAHRDALARYFAVPEANITPAAFTQWAIALLSYELETVMQDVAVLGRWPPVIPMDVRIRDARHRPELNLKRRTN